MSISEEQRPLTRVGAGAIRQRLLPGAWLAVIALYVIAVSLATRRNAALISLFSWAAAAAVAGFGCLQAARCTTGWRKRAWRLFAAACAMLIAQLLWVWIQVTRGAPAGVPSGPDLTLIAFGAFTAAAVYHFRSADPSYSSAARRWINIALISCAFGAACLAAFLEPALQHAERLDTLLTALSQLLVFAIAFVIALYVLWSHRWSALQGSPLRVVAAVALQATCGLFYVHATYVRVGGPPAYVGAAWLLSFALLHWASRDQRDASAGPPRTRTPSLDRRHERLVDAMLPGVLILMILGTLFAFRAQLSGRTLLIIGAAVLLFSIVLAVREVLVHYEEVRLENELQHRGAELARTQASLLSKTTALQETEQWLRVAADAGKIGLWAWDLASNRVYYSPQWKRQLGFEEHEIGDSFEEWRSRVHPDDLERAVAAVRSYLDAPAGDYQLEVRLRHRDGSYRWILARAALLRDPHGAPASMVGSHVDITQQKELELSLHASSRRDRERAGALEERVAERTRELQDAYRELESFSYAVAHDLKAPLRAMNSFSTLLLESPHVRQHDSERSYAERIRAGSQRMNALIEGLLDYARIDRRTMRRESASLRSCIEAALAPFAAEIERRAVQIGVAAADIEVQIDREALELALRNLLENAVKFTRARSAPVIEIRAQIESDGLLLTVHDNGIGFDMQYHDQIFAMFKRLHRDHEYPGTGIGLALAFKAAQRMQGRLWAHSEPQDGATFYLHVPVG